MIIKKAQFVFNPTSALITPAGSLGLPFTFSFHDKIRTKLEHLITTPHISKILFNVNLAEFHEY